MGTIGLLAHVQKDTFRPKIRFRSETTMSPRELVETALRVLAAWTDGGKPASADVEALKQAFPSSAHLPGTKYAHLMVEDDSPNGFADLSHAFTLFADSAKKQDVGKRGRFNLGETLVLAVCDEAEIASTKGTVVFDKAGRHLRRSKRERGSVFTGTLRMTNEEIEHCAGMMRQLISPANIATLFNGEVIPPRSPVATTTAALPTEIADEEGYLRRTSRKTAIEIYEPEPDETATLYEMGIQVVETGDRWHVNVTQKIPLNVDRDNVPPSYMALIRTVVVEATRERLTVEDANSTWVRDAIQQHGDDLAVETV